MRQGFVALLVVVTALPGCGGNSAHNTKSVDQYYANAMDVGRSSFELAHADQARVQFAAAYGRALMGDGAAAIHDAGYNQAVAELATGDASAALATVDRAYRDMALRGIAPGADLDLKLVAMAAHYRLGQYRKVLATGRHVVTNEPALSQRRSFLVGIAADALDDRVTLAAALNALPRTGSPSLYEPADRAELESRLAFREGAFSSAEALAVIAVDLRRSGLDYRGMARALDCAARAAQGAGQSERAFAYSERAVQSRTQDGNKN